MILTYLLVTSSRSTVNMISFNLTRIRFSNSNCSTGLQKEGVNLSHTTGYCVKFANYPNKNKKQLHLVT